MFKLIIFDFDGTLFDSFEAIHQAAKATLSSLLPAHIAPPSDADLRSYIATGTALSKTFQILETQAQAQVQIESQDKNKNNKDVSLSDAKQQHHDDDPSSLAAPANGTRFLPFDEDKWINTYRENYARLAPSLAGPYPGAKETLTALVGGSQAQSQSQSQPHSQNTNQNGTQSQNTIALAIVSNKSSVAIKSALENSDLLRFFPESLILGDVDLSREASSSSSSSSQPQCTFKRKPDPSSYFGLVLPRVRELYGDGFLNFSEDGDDNAGGAGAGADSDAVLMVGDTVTDIEYARGIGARACWCRYGQGDEGVCLAMEPDYVVDHVEGVLDVVFGGK